MEPNRQGNRMSPSPRRTKRGVTAIGFLILAALFGAIGLAALKIVPLYLERMRLETLLDDVNREFAGGGRTPVAIRDAVNNRLIAEGIRLPKEDIEISQSGNGYTLRIHKEGRAKYFGDLWFVVVFDKQVEIKR